MIYPQFAPIRQAIARCSQGRRSRGIGSIAQALELQDHGIVGASSAARR